MIVLKILKPYIISIKRLTLLLYFKYHISSKVSSIFSKKNDNKETDLVNFLHTTPDNLLVNTEKK